MRGGVALRGLRPGQRVRYVGVDLSPVMLERARAEARRRGLLTVELIDADVESLAFDDSSFDTCQLHRPPLHGRSGAGARGGRPRPSSRRRVCGSTAVFGAGARQDAAIRAYMRAGIFGTCVNAPELSRQARGGRPDQRRREHKRSGRLLPRSRSRSARLTRPGAGEIVATWRMGHASGWRREFAAGSDS